MRSIAGNGEHELGTVCVTLDVPVGETDRFARWLAERTSGRADTQFGDELLIDVPEE